ncbi:MAG: ribosomal RNA small subunit methyltransferase A [Acidimicrobiales bacterium]
MTLGRSDVQRLLAEHGLAPRRSLGQNFVADANTVRRIVRLADVGAGSPVVEIGAGLGSLTLALVEVGASVTAVEVDPALCRVLGEQPALAGVRVVEADATRLDWDELLAGSVGGLSPTGSAGGLPGAVADAGSASEDDAVRREPGRVSGEARASSAWTLVANLPYNVATPLVVDVLERAPAVRSLLVMVQREVGERFAASPGSGAYGAVSVKVAYWASASVVGRVPASVFVPRPRVESVLVRLERHPVPGDPSWRAGGPSYQRLFTVVRAGFAHRRKMLRRALDGVVPPAAFGATGIPGTARAEELALDQWTALASWELPARPGHEHPVVA